MFCRVIVDIVHENVAHTFTYSVPEGMKLEAGQRVEVPFGAGKKEGIVVSLCEDADYDPAKIRAVIRPLEDYAAVLPPLMELAGEMAEKAHCPLAETLRLMIPAEMRGERVRIKTFRTASLAVNAETAKQTAAEEKRLLGAIMIVILYHNA